MKNIFDTKIKDIEMELLSLKTAAEYASTRSAFAFYSQVVRTGLYRIDYKNDANLPILSRFYCQQGYNGAIYPRTPESASQVIEIDSMTYDSSTGQYIIVDTLIMIVSNVPVVSITRIS